MPDASQPLKTFSITLFRHGQSGYTQGSDPVPLEIACDLCAKPLFEDENLESRRARAIAEVQRSARSLAPTLSPAVPVTIISSPAGRTLHTSKIIRDTLTELGFRVSAIEPDPSIGEVHNYSFELLEPLITGGRFVHQTGSESYDFVIEKAVSNPGDLVYPDYFSSDALHQIPPEAMRDWPEGFVRRIRAFETFAAIKRRALACIRALAHREDGHFIVVSHEAVALYFVDRYTRGRQKGLTPGTFISIDRTADGRLVVTRVGDITDGDSETDFITAAE